jgi:inward rectifier potassium channel
VFVQTFDDMYSTVVASSSSYTFDEVVYGAKFLPMFSKSADNAKTILHLDRLNAFETISF